ncbi:MAG: acylphosphatase [Chloroflexi bacterium]|jgi:acylphosphatase|nr:MAG: acylphosphatase [Chloroflexi bacterium OLB13]MBC6956400.1 acylphosphatase [Chloroflexota bacterium]MBV6438115.1 Acylphosphatase [Anaerolineae bacterium]MDL1917065.1 acylphosphatase [Anaerolineae bacterium CFX4]MBW7880170.1 acylphosphatase [Anaerolineae bacterium]
MSATHERLHAKVTGRVQGVSFRYYTTQQALALGLSGWVMNLPDGRTVEVIAEGPRKDLQALLDWLRHGPSGARVINVAYTWEAATDQYTGFRTRHGVYDE